MSLHVGDDGKVVEVETGGHRLADEAAERLRNALPKFEFPKLEIPTGAYVALGVAGAAVVGLPLFALYLAGRAAEKALPLVAQAGPALAPLVPEAAPVLAAASILQSVRAGAPPAASAVESLRAAVSGKSGGPAFLDHREVDFQNNPHHFAVQWEDEAGRTRHTYVRAQNAKEAEDFVRRERPGARNVYENDRYLRHLEASDWLDQLGPEPRRPSPGETGAPWSAYNRAGR